MALTGFCRVINCRCRPDMSVYTPALRRYLCPFPRGYFFFSLLNSSTLFQHPRANTRGICVVWYNVRIRYEVDLSRLQSRSRMRKDGNFEIPTLGSSNKPDNGEGGEKQSVSLQGNFCGNQSSTVVRPRGAREGNDLADLLNVFNDTSKEGRSLSVLVRCPRRSPLSYEQSTANRSLWSIYVRVIKTRNRRGWLIEDDAR